MPITQPISASGAREPKKPRPVPKQIKAALVLMVRGRPDDSDGKPLDFIEAAKACDVKPDHMRRWLDRPEARAFLGAERKAFRAAVCAGNEAALLRVREKSENGMAVIGAVRALENLDEEEAARHRGGPQQTPGFIIQVINGPNNVRTIPAQAPAAPLTIEHREQPAD